MQQKWDAVLSKHRCSMVNSICMLHFRQIDYKIVNNRPTLLKNSVPTIFQSEDDPMNDIFPNHDETSITSHDDCSELKNEIESKSLEIEVLKTQITNLTKEVNELKKISQSDLVRFASKANDQKVN